MRVLDFSDGYSTASAPTVSGGTASQSQFLAGGGSASSPAYTFTSDGNTGIYNSGTDVLDFATAGTRRAWIDADGDMFLISESDGSVNEFSVQNTSDTAGSDARVRISTGGNSGGDPYLMFEGFGQASIGMDNSRSDVMVISHGPDVNTAMVCEYTDTTWTFLEGVAFTDVDAPSSGTPTFATLPSGATAAQSTWIQVTANGVAGIVPFWRYT